MWVTCSSSHGKAKEREIHVLMQHFHNFNRARRVCIYRVTKCYKKLHMEGDTNSVQCISIAFKGKKNCPGWQPLQSSSLTRTIPNCSALVLSETGHGAENQQEGCDWIQRAGSFKVSRQISYQKKIKACTKEYVQNLNEQPKRTDFRHDKLQSWVRHCHGVNRSQPVGRRVAHFTCGYHR